MAVDHKNIADGSIHEPKGISTAIGGTVYRADGNGSGVWTTIDNPVFIELIIAAIEAKELENG